MAVKRKIKKDPDGFWVGFQVVAFSYMYGPQGGPQTPEQLTDPRWAGKIVSGHPGDDDAVLYLYKAYIEACGWQWLDALTRQRIVFHRGTNTPADWVNDGRAGQSGKIPTLTSPGSSIS